MIKHIHALSNDPPETILCELFYKYGSDKCPQIYHSYSTGYYELLKNDRENFLNILEIGVGTDLMMKPIAGEIYQIGASLKAWRDFFINGNVYAFDIDKSVLFEEERIKCFYTDQSDETSLNYSIYEIRKHINDDNMLFDFILDDGSHVLNHQILTLNTLFKYLKSGGIYIIEDIKRNEIKDFKNIQISGGKIIKIYEGHPTLNGDAFIVIKKD